MKPLLFLLIVIAACAYAQNPANFAKIQSFFTSKESLIQKLEEKQELRAFYTQSLAQAQANAPHCGGKQMIVKVSSSTQDEIRELDAEIQQLRLQIQKK